MKIVWIIAHILVTKATHKPILATKFHVFTLLYKRAIALPEEEEEEEDEEEEGTRCGVG